MRKSTLITTIAMIVVVVVALSTATYAWFSSTTQQQATQTITSTATGDWALSAGTFDDSDTTTITWQPATEEIVLDGSQGLYCPTEVLGNFINTNSDTTAQVQSQTNTFLNCMTIKNAAIVQSVKQMKPTLLRVYNQDGSASKTLHLTVWIKLGTNPTQQQKRAAIAMSFYIATSNSSQAGASNSDINTGDTIKAENKYYTLGYGWADHTVTGTTAYQSDAWAAAPVSQTYNASFVAKEAATKVAKSASTITASMATIPTYNQAGNATFSKATASGFGEGASILAANEYYLGYKIALGTVAAGEGMNILMYSWMDGWTADTSCLGASLNMIYGFSASGTTFPDAIS